MRKRVKRWTPIQQMTKLMSQSLAPGLTELQKDTDGDNEKACKKMDTNPADDKIDEPEFGAWIEKQPFDARVKTEHGEVIDAMWQIMKQRGEDFMTLDGCKKDLKKLADKFSAPPVL